MNTTLNKFAGLYRIIRPVNFIITFATIVIAGYFSSDSGHILNVGKIILAALSGALVAAAGNIINDYFDLEIDRINRPERVLPSEILTPMEAVSYYFFISVLAVFISSFVNIYCLLVVIYSTTGIYLYSSKFKGIPLAGNIVVAHFTGLAFIYGGIAQGNWIVCIIPAVFAFLINFIREIVKDIEDIKGDSAGGIITYPQKYGIRKSLSLILYSALILIILTILPYKYELYRIEYFLIVMCVVNVLLVYFLKRIYIYNSNEELRKLSNLLKIVMVAGLAAIFIGK